MTYSTLLTYGYYHHMVIGSPYSPPLGGSALNTAPNEDETVNAYTCDYTSSNCGSITSNKKASVLIQGKQFDNKCERFSGKWDDPDGVKYSYGPNTNDWGKLTCTNIENDSCPGEKCQGVITCKDKHDNDMQCCPSLGKGDGHEIVPGGTGKMDNMVRPDNLDENQCITAQSPRAWFCTDTKGTCEKKYTGASDAKNAGCSNQGCVTKQYKNKAGQDWVKYCENKDQDDCNANSNCDWTGDKKTDGYDDEDQCKKNCFEGIEKNDVTYKTGEKPIKLCTGSIGWCDLLDNVGTTQDKDVGYKGRFNNHMWCSCTAQPIDVTTSFKFNAKEGKASSNKWPQSGCCTTYFPKDTHTRILNCSQSSQYGNSKISTISCPNSNSNIVPGVLWSGGEIGCGKHPD